MLSLAFCVNWFISGLDWKWAKKQSMTKEKLWETYKKPGALLLRMTLKKMTKKSESKIFKKSWMAQNCTVSTTISTIFECVLNLRSERYLLFPRLPWWILGVEVPVFLSWVSEQRLVQQADRYVWVWARIHGTALPKQWVCMKFLRLKQKKSFNKPNV